MKSESDRATEAWTEIWMWNERWGHTSLVSKTIFGQLKIRCITLLPTLCIISTINFISTKRKLFCCLNQTLGSIWISIFVISSFVISQYNKQCNAWRTYGNLRIVYVSLLVFSSLKYVKRNGRMGLLRVNTSASSQTQELLTGPTDLLNMTETMMLKLVPIVKPRQSSMIIFITGEPASLIRRAGGQEM